MPFELAEFPGSIKFAVYAHLTELHGKYRLELRLEDSQGDVLWAVRADPPVKHEDPLMPHRFAFRDLNVRVAAPGRYDLLLVSEDDRNRPAPSLADGRRAARRDARFGMRPAAESMPSVGDEDCRRRMLTRPEPGGFSGIL